MSLRTFLRTYREEIDRRIRAVPCANGQRFNDRERRLWVLNDEGLYNWARSLGGQAVSEDLSPRQELLRFVETGALRDECAERLSDEACDLLVTIVLRYCEPRRPSRS